MTCLSADAVVLFLRQELEPSERKAAQEHLDVCAACRQLIANLAETSLLPEASGDDSPWLNDFLEAGAQINRYIVQARVGQGAMGVVYRARDPELARPVAIKLVRSSAADDEGQRRRLLREARALAQISEPNVMPVYDAGIHQGRVFIVMEFVEGESLRDLLSQTRPGSKRILEYFVAAGRGLAAAHAEGIVHRDFKPDNVLHTHDERILVSDFGLASQVQDTEDSVQGDGSETDLSRTGGLIGTPAYMAPEQLDGGKATPASDQFSFCVALFEAFTGVRPFPGNTIHALRESIASGPGATLRRSQVPRSLRRILARGLQPDPAARYGSMDALLRDLQRRPNTRLYIAGVAALALTAAIVVPAVIGTGETECEPMTDDTWTEAQRGRVQDAFAHTELPYATLALDVVDQRLGSHAVAWTEAAALACPPRPALTACLHRDRANVRAIVDVLADADATVVEHAFELVSDLPDPRDCETAPTCATDGAGGDSCARPIDPKLAALLARVAAEVDAGRLQAAERLADEALSSARAAGDEPSEARALLLRGTIVADTQGTPRAIEDVTAAYQLAIGGAAPGVAADSAIHLAFLHGREAISAEEGLEWSRHAQAALDRIGGDPTREAQLQGNIAAIHATRADFDAAREGYVAARELWIAARSENHPDVANASTNLGVVLNRLGRYDDAIAQYERALSINEATVGTAHPAFARALENLGNLYVRRFDLERAEPLLTRALGVFEQAMGEHAPSVGRANANLANVYLRKGELEEATAHYERARKIYDAAYGPDHAGTVSLLVGLSGVAQARGEFARADTQLAEAGALAERSYGSKHPEVALIAYNRCSTLSVTENLAEAQRQCERAIEIWVAALGPEHPHVARAYEDLANVRSNRAAFEASLAAADRACAIQTAIGGELGRCLAVRAIALLGLGRHAEAAQVARSAVPLVKDPANQAAAEFTLARALAHARGSRSEALELARKARIKLAAAGPIAAPLVDEIDDWLRTMK